MQDLAGQEIIAYGITGIGYQKDQALMMRWHWHMVPSLEAKLCYFELIRKTV